MQCPPSPGPGRIEWHEAERLGLCRVHYFPDVDPHFHERDFQLVHQRDIDRAKDVLHQLRRFGGSC